MENKECIKNFVMLSQSYATKIEHILCRVFSCERDGVGGIVDSDYIRKRPVISMIHAATYLYANADYKQKEKIEKFIRGVRYYSEWSIDTLLSFESNEKVIDGTTYGLEFDNGKKELEHIIEEFEKITDF